MTGPARTWGPAATASGMRFRLWAPGQQRLALRHDGADHAMHRDDDGWFELVRPAAFGDAYAFVLEDGSVAPDPAARAQTGDVHAASRLIDPDAYSWRTADWPGRPWEEAAICELHVGAFTPEGTFRAAIDRLDHIARAGFTTIELMPVAQFSGDRGWGYDGVLLYAPHPAYGSPDDLKALVDAAHERGLMVLLDVVYNHFGPDGNYISAYAPTFFHPEKHTPWGVAIAYERAAVRAFFIENALYWLDEFRLDGLRLDAVDHVRDPGSPVEILVELAQAVRAAHPDRHVHLTTEDNRNITRLHERGPGGETLLYTAEWNDDLHNVAHVLATGETEGYYVDFAEGPWRTFARTLAEGFGYQGEPSTHGGGAPRGAPSGHMPPTAFLDFLQNHDQIGNRAFGERLLTLANPAMMRALTAVLLLSPHVPLMFMGDEWGATTPFAFFSDFEGDLAEAVREGRRREFEHFAAFADDAVRATIPDPCAPGTFEASRLDWAAPATESGRAWLGFVRDLLALRRAEIAPLLRGAGGHSGEALSFEDGAVSVRWRLTGADLWLRANLADRAQTVPPAPGRTLHATGDAGPDATMPAHAVLWTIAEPGSRP